MYKHLIINELRLINLNRMLIFANSLILFSIKNLTSLVNYKERAKQST
jgi:hypothetical protein